MAVSLKTPQELEKERKDKLVFDTQHVIIHYGPTERFYTLCHRPQKLTGITIKLRSLNYQVELNEVPWLNLCVFEMCGHEIFSTDLNNFGFNLPFEIDRVAKIALEAVLDATERFTRSGDYLAIYSQMVNLGEDVAQKPMSKLLQATDSVAAWKSTIYYADVVSYMPL